MLGKKCLLQIIINAQEEVIFDIYTPVGEYTSGNYEQK
jgi:hypothetical protein